MLGLIVPAIAVNAQEKSGGESKSADSKKVESKQDDSKKQDTGKADDSKKQDSAAADHPVTKLLDEWDTMRASMVAARERYNLAIIKTEMDAAEKEFMDLYEKGNAHIDKIVSTSFDSIKKDKNDEVAWNALAGILVNYASDDKADTKCFELAAKMDAAGVDVAYYQAARDLPRLSLFNRGIIDEIIIRRTEREDDDLPRVKITTDKGEVVIELFENEAPDTVGNFISLVESKFFEGSPFHRVLENFVAQGGGAAEGKKDVDYKIYCECNKPDARMHFTGSLSMAHAGLNTGSSEFFITFRKTSELDRKHTVFGRVIQGMDIVNSTTITHETVTDPDTFSTREVPIKDATPVKIVKMEVVRKRPHEYQPKKVGDVDRPDNNPPSVDNKSKKGDDKKSEDKKADDKSEKGESKSDDKK